MFRFFDECGWVIVVVALLFIGAQIVRALIKWVAV